MNSNKNVFRIILAIIIIIAFFLPWFKMGGGSGLDIVLAKGYQEETSSMVARYSFLLIPLFALIVLIKCITTQSAGFFIRLLPFLVTAILTALFIIGITSDVEGGGNLQSWFSVISYGYYLTVIASLLLLFV